MEKIDSSNILQAIKDMKSGESLFVSIPQSETDRLRYIDLQLQSYESLFRSYINGTSEKADEFNLQNFLDIYLKSFNERFYAFRDVMINNVGKNGYMLISDSNTFKNIVDYELNTLIMTRL
jgi:hypothetical protein